jgi:hypothetical protein
MAPPPRRSESPLVASCHREQGASDRQAIRRTGAYSHVTPAAGLELAVALGEFQELTPSRMSRPWLRRRERPACRVALSP